LGLSPQPSAPGIPLARLFAMSYHHFLEGLHSRLAELGWHDVRPSYGFVLLAARDAPITQMEIAALMGTTKQAASVLVAGMEQAGYLRRTGAASDGRVKSFGLTERARELLDVVEAVYAELEARWADVIGRPALEDIRRDVQAALEATHGGVLPGIRPTK
jgi:DNA-binding MarR family transcriptional regulator